MQVNSPYFGLSFPIFSNVVQCILVSALLISFNLFKHKCYFQMPNSKTAHKIGVIPQGNFRIRDINVS